MADGYHLNYVGKKLVRANPDIGIRKPYYVHVVEIISEYTEHYQVLQQIFKLNDWCQEEFGETAYSLDPTDDGEYFKFRSKEHAARFKLANG